MDSKFVLEIVDHAGTAILAVMAILTFLETLKMQKNSAFNALFSQLIGHHQELFDDQEVSAGFYKYFNKRVDSIKTMPDLCKVWKGYGMRIGEANAVRFSHSFKYVYHEVVTVLTDTTISRKQKRHYIGIIQAYMNKDELFCYLVNLLQHFEQYPDEEEYREKLKRYGFFNDLMRKHDQRYRVVMSHLSTYLYADVNKLINL